MKPVMVSLTGMAETEVTTSAVEANLLRGMLLGAAGDPLPLHPLGLWVTFAAVLACARAAGATVILEHLDEPAVLASIAYLEAHGLV